MIKLIRGGNAPIKMTFDIDMSSLSEIDAVLGMYLHWTKDDMVVEGRTITIPVSQEESLRLPIISELIFKIKGLDEDGAVRIFENIPVSVCPNINRNILGSDDPYYGEVISTDPIPVGSADSVIIKRGEFSVPGVISQTFFFIPEFFII